MGGGGGRERRENSRPLSCKYKVVCTSVADPYHLDTDPDPGPEKIRYGSGSRQKRNQYQENRKKFEAKNTHFPCFVCRVSQFRFKKISLRSKT